MRTYVLSPARVQIPQLNNPSLEIQSNHDVHIGVLRQKQFLLRRHASPLHVPAQDPLPPGPATPVLHSPEGFPGDVLRRLGHREGGEVLRERLRDPRRGRVLRQGQEEHQEQTLLLLKIAVTLLLSACALLATGQSYTDNGNYINSELYADYESEGQRPVHPTPRSYSSAPAARQQPAAPKPTPVAILKQINRHNEDGSYTYGFEGADGSFKIETKQANGEVKGKYGFVDDSGKVRVVEYGADQYGFQPSGEGITVAPPTLVDETTSKEALEAQRIQDYQELQQQALAARAPARPQPTATPSPRAQVAYNQPQYVPQYETQQHTQAIYQPRPAAKAVAYAPAEARPQQYLQSQLIQQAQLYESEAASAYKNGPVQFGPAPVQEPRASQAVRPQPQARSGGGGILDQLARDYALPQNSAPPLHDISFGYY